MNHHDDPVDAVILAFLDHLEGVGPRPALDHLDQADRERAAELMRGMAVARGLEPGATRPSIEALLVDTPLAPLFPRPRTAAGEAADLVTMRDVLAGVDPRARVEPDGGGALLSYLDLRARFLLVPAAVPVVTDDIRAAVAQLFAADPDTSRVGLVAAHSPDLSTQLLAVDEIGDTITTPRGEPHRQWEPPLPLALAARRLLEQSAPEWAAFDFDGERLEPLDVAGIAGELARRVIERESTRPYRGDKRAAYRALAGQERLFADLVALAASPGAGLDLGAETARILRAAA
jgi:hypothetical protein